MQPHGGALRTRGNPGNKGGAGRPPNVIRDNFRQILDGQGTKHIRQVLEGTVVLAQKCEKCGHRPKRNLRLESTVGDRNRVVEILARFGIGTSDQLNVHSPEVLLRVQQTVAVISSRSKWDSEELLNALDEVW